MPGPSIKDELIKLIGLQEIDLALLALNKEKDGAPAKLAEIDASFNEMKVHLKDLEEKRQKMTLDQKAREGDLAAKEEEIKKTTSQLGQLKTNKEYQAKLAEIEGLKADKSVAEEDILKFMDTIEAGKAPIEEEHQRLVQGEKKFAQERAVIADRIKQIEAEAQTWESKRTIAAADIDKTMLMKYEHILHGQKGTVLVPVRGNSCQGCHMNVPHQVVNLIRMHEQLISCEICSRILYLEDDDDNA